MQITHHRGTQNHELILALEKEETPAKYILRMLEKQTIPGFLPCKVQSADNRVWLRYDVTSAVSLLDIYEKRMMKEQDVRFWIAECKDAIQNAEKYLLPPEYVSLDPSRIFLRETASGFCFCPGKKETLAEEMTGFFEFLIGHLDHSEQRIVRIVYDIYGKIRSGEENWMQLLDLSDDTEETVQTQEQPKKPVHEREGREEDFEMPSSKKTGTAFALIAGGMAVLFAALFFVLIRVLKAGPSLMAGILFILLGIYGGSLLLVSRLFSGKEKKDEMPAEVTETGEEKKDTAKQKKEKREKQTSFPLFRKKREVPEERTEELSELEEETLFERSVEAGTKEDSLRARLTEEMLGNAVIKEETEGKEEKNMPETEYNQQELPEMKWEEEAREFPKTPEEPVRREMEQEWFGDTAPINLKGMRLPAFVSMDSEKRIYYLAEEVILIGKVKPQTQILLKTNGISRIHAKLEQKGGEYFLTDLFSTNGTYVNGTRLEIGEKRKLVYGDQIQFAQESFRYQEEVIEEM